MTVNTTIQLYLEWLEVHNTPEMVESYNEKTARGPFYMMEQMDYLESQQQLGEVDAPWVREVIGRPPIDPWDSKETINMNWARNWTNFEYYSFLWLGGPGNRGNYSCECA